jgi:hypothetical protein
MPMLEDYDDTTDEVVTPIEIPPIDSTSAAVVAAIRGRLEESLREPLMAAVRDLWGSAAESLVRGETANADETAARVRQADAQPGPNVRESDQDGTLEVASPAYAAMSLRDREASKVADEVFQNPRRNNY